MPDPRSAESVDSPRSRPQEPDGPLPYDEEEVGYDTSAAGVRLAGTLTKPRSSGPHPAALLITGSGPHDRDETVMGHRPFLVLADQLTRLGLAVLRVDDRGVGESSGDGSGATTADLAEDARASLAFLGKRADIDARRIGLIGHSEGAIIAAMLAAESSAVSWIVMLAGSGVTGERVLLSQTDSIAAAAGVPESVRAEIANLNRAIYGVVQREPDDETVQAAIRKLIDTHEKTIASAAGGDPAPLLAGVKSQVPTLASPWFRAFLTYDPAPTLRRVKVPELAMNGELDLQVPPEQNLPAIVAALEEGGNGDYAVVKLPRLNHLFQTASTGSPAEYEAIEETFAPIAFVIMSEWIKRHASLTEAADPAR